jgi:pimeloyl-ACP methyl ester carboxylesterase
MSSDPRLYAATADEEVVRARAASFRDIAIRRIPQTGHNIHHDAPAVVAEAIQSFMRGGVLPRAT